jgi:hypothetical protein
MASGGGSYRRRAMASGIQKWRWSAEVKDFTWTYVMLLAFLAYAAMVTS